MKLQCPECRQMLQLPDGQEGRQGRCPKCGAIFRIGDGPPPGASDEQPGFQEPVRKPNEFGEKFSSPEPKPVSGLGEQWQLRIADGRIFGPVGRTTLDQWVREGRVGQDSQLKRTTDPDWQPAKSFYPYLRTGSSPASSNTTFADRATSAPRSVSQQPHRGGVILTLGLLGFCCWICGVIAIIMGSQDLNRMKAGLMDRSGEGTTRAGFILGIIATVIQVLGLFGKFAARDFNFDF